MNMLHDADPRRDSRIEQAKKRWVPMLWVATSLVVALALSACASAGLGMAKLIAWESAGVYVRSVVPLIFVGLGAIIFMAIFYITDVKSTVKPWRFWFAATILLIAFARIVFRLWEYLKYTKGVGNL